MRTRFFLWAAAVLAAARPAPAQEDFSGVWKVDSTRSASLALAFQRHAQDDGLHARGSLSGAQASSAGQVPGLGAGVPDMTSSRPISPEEATALARPLVYEGDGFHVVQADTTLTIHPLNLADETVLLATDGEKRDTQFGDPGLEGTLKAEWKGDRLRIERKAPDLQVREEWWLAEGGVSLVQDVEIKGRMLKKTLTYRRIYQREG